MNLCLVDLKVMLSVIVKTGSAHPQLLSHLHHVIVVSEWRVERANYSQILPIQVVDPLTYR